MSVVRSTWTDPDDMRPNARHAREIAGYRRYCPLRRCLAQHGDRSSFTGEHIQAADRLRACFDGARLGFSGLKGLRPAGHGDQLPPLAWSRSATASACTSRGSWRVFRQLLMMLARAIGDISIQNVLNYATLYEHGGPAVARGDLAE
jgi:hypothetical protein